jgi:hypothetical protein
VARSRWLGVFISSSFIMESDSESSVASTTTTSAPEADTFDDFFEEPDLHWLSDDQIKEMYEKTQDGSVKVPPPLKDWIEIDPRETTYQVTFGKARRVLWGQFKQEHALFMHNVTKIKCSTNSLSLQTKVYDFLFGPSSEIANLFMGKLELEKSTYLGFMMTFFKSCRYKMPIAALQGSIDNLWLMPTKEYNGIWRKITMLQRNPRGESFWQELEFIINIKLLELFLGPNDDAETDNLRNDMQWLLGLDDDKLHFNYSGATDSDGLKKDHHAKDNRHGFTAHTCCFSATAVPIQVAFQREGETVVTCTRRLINDIYGKHTGQAIRLHNVSFFMDRGYWNAKVFFDLLDKGADIHGTVKRMDWIPITYVKKGGTKKKGKEEDAPFPMQPKKVSLVGYKDAYHMSLKWKGSSAAGRKVDLFAYRSGSGTAVSLIASSVYRRDHFDLAPVTEADQGWYHDKDLPLFHRQLKGLKLLVGKHDDKYAKDLFARIEPRTCSQGTPEWFIDRQFAATSSTMCSIILSMAPLIDQLKEPVLWASFETVLGYAGVKDTLLGGVVREQEKAAEQEAVAAAVAAAERETAASSDTEDEENQQADPKATATNWIARLTDPTLQNDAAFVDQVLKDNSTVRANLEMLQWMQTILKQPTDEKKSTATVGATQKFFTDWLSKETLRRLYDPLTVNALKAIAMAKGILVKGKKSDIIDELLKPMNEQQQVQAPSSPSLQPYITLFKQSFLRPQTNEDNRSAAAIGHRNEEPFLKAFFDACNGTSDSPYAFSSLNPKALYRLGLVRKAESSFAKASLDGIVVLEEDLDFECIPVEVKSRVSVATMTEAADRIEEFVGVESYRPTSKYLVHARSSDPLFRLLLHDNNNKRREQHESFQLLHSAFVAGTNRGLLLVGSDKDLMYGVHVHFDQELLDAYEAIVDYVYDRFLKPFYECTPAELNERLGNEIIEATKEVEHLDEHSFWTNYGIWRALNVDTNRANISFPLPPAARCLPFQNAYWNAMKGPSDTTTKLIDRVEEKLGVRKPRTIATSRLLTITAVAFHRSSQMIKTDINRFSTVQSCRHAATNRCDMSRSLDLLIRYLDADLKKLKEEGTNSLLQRPLIVSPHTPPKRNLRGKQAIEQLSWGAQQQAGYTPCRGRAVNDFHQMREKACDGRVLLYRVPDPNTKLPDGKKKDVRKPCRLCKANTSFYCSGCKNHLCFGSAAITPKKAEQIVNHSGGAIVHAPKSYIRIPVYDPKTEDWKHVFAANSCYLLHHKDAFDSKDWNYNHGGDGEEGSSSSSGVVPACIIKSRGTTVSIVGS